jgi:hypothetical protein
MEVSGETAEVILAKKPPRKPRPSEIAAKAAKAVKRSKPKTKPKTAKKKVGNGRPLVRTERMDLRLTKQERAKVMARVKKTGNTVTGVIMEAVAKARW